jgi:hypothetical protein
MGILFLMLIYNPEPEIFQGAGQEQAVGSPWFVEPSNTAWGHGEMPAGG